MQRSPVVDHARGRIREELTRFMELSKREGEIIVQIQDGLRELFEIRRELQNRARAAAVDAAALLAHVERKERPAELLAD